MRMTLNTMTWRRREMVRWLVSCATEIGEYMEGPLRKSDRPQKNWPDWNAVQPFNPSTQE